MLSLISHPWKSYTPYHQIIGRDGNTRWDLHPNLLNRDSTHWIYVCELLHWEAAVSYGKFQNYDVTNYIGYWDLIETFGVVSLLLSSYSCTKIIQRLKFHAIGSKNIEIIIKEHQQIRPI